MLLRNIALLSCTFSVACAASSSDGGGITTTDASLADSQSVADSASGDDAGLVVDAMPVEGGPPEGTSTIYATTDTALWSMDPPTKKVTEIGPFDFGAATPANVTDVAVDKDGVVYVTTETTIFTATLPASGTGKVVLTKKLALPSGSKFYALGIAPEGVLETGEALVVGEPRRPLLRADQRHRAEARQLRRVRVGRSARRQGRGRVAALGDVVFFSIGGSPRGLATLRPCTKTGTCQNGNDVVAEIDMAALATKSPTAKLRKSFLGSGTGYAKLFGIGAWEDSVYAFSLVSKGTTPVAAQLVTIDPSGKGSLTQSFPSIADGWTGAGITTKAKVSVIK
jgi:hypothetical protein